MSSCPVAIGRPSAFRAVAIVALPTSGSALRPVRGAAARAKENLAAYNFRFELLAQGSKNGRRVTFGFQPSQATVID